MFLYQRLLSSLSSFALLLNFLIHQLGILVSNKKVPVMIEWDNLYNIGSSQGMITAIIYMISKYNVKDVNESDIYK